jgi:phenylpropionate dioxygenase-like ring-hydroxylating dioxygenase large terminal subunit
MKRSRLGEEVGLLHHRGTVACPYHGWVFDDGGNSAAVLAEGPDSAVWIGDGSPGDEVVRR